MALSSNETSWATTIVTLIVTMAFGSFLTYITIKSQHAKSLEDVQEAVKNIAARVVLWLSNIGAFTLLVRELISVEPLSRKSVFIMVWTSCILVTTFLFSIIMRVMNALLKSTELHAKGIEATSRLSAIVMDILKSLPCSRPPNTEEILQIQDAKDLPAAKQRKNRKKSV